MPFLNFDAIFPVDRVLQAPALTPIAQYMSDDMVDIYIGDERQKFRLHRNLLCERSEFFRASFRGHFKEAGVQELVLPEDSVGSFELLVEWLYGALTSIPTEDNFLTYLDLVILANKLCLEHLQNEAMDLVLRFFRLSPPAMSAHTIRSIYCHTTAGDPLRRFMIRCVAFAAVSSKITVFDSVEQDLLEGGGEIAVDFTSCLAKYYARSEGNHTVLMRSDPRLKSNCSYHRHNYTPACSDSFE